MITFDGFDDDGGLYEIPVIRSFMTKLHAEWPYIFYFHELQSPLLATLVACMIPRVSILRTCNSGTIVFANKDLSQFIDENLESLHEVFKRAGMGSKLNEHIRLLKRYFVEPYKVT